MLLGHGAIGQFGVAEALSGLVVNASIEDSESSTESFALGSIDDIHVWLKDCNK